jgi:hypothetical protein
MTENNGQDGPGKNPPAANAAGTSESPTSVEFMSQHFDIATPEGKAGFEAAKTTFNKLFGDQSRKVGELRKENAPLRKYNLGSTATDDDLKIREKVDEFVQNGEPEKALPLMFEYIGQVRNHSEAERVKERGFEELWGDYKTERGGFSSINEEKAFKTYVKTEYYDKLAEAEDPFQILDAVIGPKRVASDPPEETGAAFLDSASSKSKMEPPTSVEADEDVEKVFKKHLADMGFSD